MSKLGETRSSSDGTFSLTTTLGAVENDRVYPIRVLHGESHLFPLTTRAGR